MPLENEKIRYPVVNEMEKCFPNLIEEIDHFQPSKVFLLGKQVSEFVLKKLSFRLQALDENFNYKYYTRDEIDYIPIHHPSFILVYKHKNISRYIGSVQSFLVS